ncbi:MAG TPA: DNA recombination protein RmuC [Vicinamibacteria bacterium]|nr:DNA recombination protein RmuC [Vicinamibacteria bacterium]
MDPLAAVLALAGRLLAVLAGYAIVAARRPAGTAADPAAVARLQDTLDRVAHTQDELRLEVQRSREDALVGLSGAAQDLQGRLAQAQRALAEVKALEQARGSQLDRATESLRRLELVVAGSASRGAAGENVLARAFSQLPPDLLETDAAFGGRVVEYALRLPGGRLLPIDSKWTGVAELERLETTDDPDERRRLRDRLAREVRLRAREMARYLDPERTLALAVLAVPDAVHAETPEAHAEGWREGVLVVPYSLALPFVLALYRLAARFASAPAAEELGALLARLPELLQRMDEEVEGRLSRAVVQAANARDALRGDLAEARRAASRLAGFDRPQAGG